MPYGQRKKTGRLHADDYRRWPREVREKLYAQIAAEEAAERAAELESQGWRVWYATIFGTEFTDNLAPHHIEALEWHWLTMLTKRAGLVASPNAYFAVWPRGHRKSDLIRHIAVADACVLSKGYCLYVSSSRGKVHEHALSVERLLHGDAVRDYYPQLSKVDKTLTGQQRSWTSDRMISEVGYTFHFVGLNEGVAGANVDNVRPTLVVLDDVDEREDSPLISAQRLKVLTRSVLPTRQRNTVFFSAQNYISRHGVIYQIHTGRVPALANRVQTKPIPAFYNLVTEHRTIDGQPRDVLVSGTPSWQHYDLAAGQAEVDDITLDAFRVECQHEVEEDKTGVVLVEYNDDVHAVGWQAFNSLYGLPPENREVPAHWRRYIGHDWGSSSGHNCVVSFFAVAGQNSPLAGTVYMYRLLTFPPSTLVGTVAHAVLNTVLADVQADPSRYIELGLLDRAAGDPNDPLAGQVRRRVAAELAALPQYSMWHMDHANKAVRDVYRILYSLPFQPCVDEGEVLTQNGWVSIANVQVGDYVYSCNLGGVLELKRVQATQHQWYSGEMVRVRSKGLYQSFTPDHQVLYRNDNKGASKEKWRLDSWRDIKTKTVDMIRAPTVYFGDGDWEPPFGCIDRKTFMAFLGLWLAEGCIDKTGNGVRITQCATLRQPAVVQLLAQTPWKFKLYRNGDFITSDAALHHYLASFGKAHQKFIPREILQHATAEELAALFDWMMFGDGATDGSCYYTTSSALADDFCELAVKLGWKVYQREQPCHCQPPNPAHRSQWIINLARSRFPSTKVAKIGASARLNAFREPYTGMVYDLTVEGNHTFVIRQQGRVWISGNCNPKRAGGVPQLRHYLRADYNEPHPFYPDTKKGLARMYLLADDAQLDDPRDDRGMALARQQFSDWRWRPEIITSKGLLDERPLKLDDDVPNSAMMVFAHFSLQSTPLTYAEKVEAAVPPNLRYSELLRNSPFEHGLTPEQELSHLQAVKYAKSRMHRGRIQRFDENGQRVR